MMRANGSSGTVTCVCGWGWRVFPLPPREAVFVAELFRWFPDAREVTEGVFRRDRAAEPTVLTGARQETTVSLPAPSVTSQASLFDERRAA